MGAIPVGGDAMDMHRRTEGNQANLMATNNPIELILANFSNHEHRQIVLGLTRDYFAWMNLEIQQVMGRSIPEIVGMELEAYIASVIDSICRSAPPESAFHIALLGGRAVGMGGITTLTRWQCRGGSNLCETGKSRPGHWQNRSTGLQASWRLHHTRGQNLLKRCGQSGSTCRKRSDRMTFAIASLSFNQGIATLMRTIKP